MSMSLVGECREKGEPHFRFAKHLKPRQGVEEARAVLCQARFPLIFIPKCILKEMKSTCFWSFILKSSKYCLLGALCVRKPIEPFSLQGSLPPGKISRKRRCAGGSGADPGWASPPERAWVGPPGEGWGGSHRPTSGLHPWPCHWLGLGHWTQPC